jgi:hypothetical protein
MAGARLGGAETAPTGGPLMRKSIAVCLLAAVAAISPFPALAQPITVPTGLNPGDQYRLAFVTFGGLLPGSPNIGDYNAFVTTQANSVPQLAALGTTWSAIGTTTAVNAYDNTHTHPGIDAGYPLYNLAGDLVISSTLGLWSSNLSAPIDVTQSGDTITVAVWTGTLPAGNNNLGGQLGNPELGLVIVGISDRTNVGDWISVTEDPTTFNSLYAMSGVLTVVPEPSTLVLACLAAAGLAVPLLRRCRR